MRLTRKTLVAVPITTLLAAMALAGCASAPGGAQGGDIAQACVKELPADEWARSGTASFRSGDHVRAVAIGYDRQGKAVEAVAGCTATDGGWTVMIDGPPTGTSPNAEAPAAGGLIACAQATDAESRWISYDNKLYANTSAEAGGERLCALEKIEWLSEGPAGAFFRMGTPAMLGSAGPQGLKAIAEKRDRAGFLAQCLHELPFNGPVIVDSLDFAGAGSEESRTAASATLTDADGNHECTLLYGGRSDLDYSLSY